MKQRLSRYIFRFFAACTAVLAGLVGYQKICLAKAQKKKDSTHFQEYFSTPWGEIAYRSGGHGRPLLLIHSMMCGASCREWDQVFDALAAEYHVYAIDLPGFGNSFRPEKPWTAYQYALVLHDFIERHIQRSVCICGANGGGDLALVLSKLYPEDIRRMVLISPEGIGKGFATEADTKPLPLLLSPVAGTQKFLLGTTKGSMKAMLERAFYAKERISANLVRQYADAARYGVHAQATYAGITTRFWAADTKTAFSSLAVPFLLIWGEENKENPVFYFHQAEKMTNHGDFALFEQTGALPHMENSRAFCTNLQQFLK